VNKYLLISEGKVEALTDRPTQPEIKARGRGEYTLRMSDGRVSKHYTVKFNRRGNLQVVADAPTGLEGLSMAVMLRLQRNYQTIVKHWPEKSRDLTKVEAEISLRQSLLRFLAAKSEAVAS
jgi:hypothetical protein